jgi:hypothetical protein
MLDIYWELRPCAETQALYKARGLQPYDYWTYELEDLTCSTWAKDPALPQRLLKKYENSEKIHLDEEDREVLGCAFPVDLGMNPATFTVNIP